MHDHSGLLISHKNRYRFTSSDICNQKAKQRVPERTGLSCSKVIKFKFEVNKNDIFHY